MGLRPTQADDKRQTEFSSRPERTGISYVATVRNDHVCDFPQREAHELYQRHHYQQEIRGSEVEGPAVLDRLSWKCFSTELSRAGMTRASHSRRGSWSLFGDRRDLVSPIIAD
jgi:hypothetical protein